MPVPNESSSELSNYSYSLDSSFSSMLERKGLEVKWKLQKKTCYLCRLEIEVNEKQKSYKEHNISMHFYCQQLLRIPPLSCGLCLFGLKTSEITLLLVNVLETYFYPYRDLPEKNKRRSKTKKSTRKNASDKKTKDSLSNENNLLNSSKIEIEQKTILVKKESMSLNFNNVKDKKIDIFYSTKNSTPESTYWVVQKLKCFCQPCDCKDIFILPVYLYGETSPSFACDYHLSRLVEAYSFLKVRLKEGFASPIKIKTFQPWKFFSKEDFQSLLVGPLGFSSLCVKSYIPIVLIKGLPATFLAYCLREDKAYLPFPKKAIKFLRANQKVSKGSLSSPNKLIKDNVDTSVLDNNSLVKTTKNFKHLNSSGDSESESKRLRYSELLSILSRSLSFPITAFTLSQFEIVPVNSASKFIPLRSRVIKEDILKAVLFGYSHPGVVAGLITNPRNPAYDPGRLSCGTFASKDFPAKVIVLGEYKGLVQSKNEHQKANGKLDGYFFGLEEERKQFDKDDFLGVNALNGRSVAVYANDWRDLTGKTKRTQNTLCVEVKVNGRHHIIWITAGQKIRKHSELLTDYGGEYWKVHKEYLEKMGNGGIGG